MNHCLSCMISHPDVKPDRNSQLATPKLRKLQHTNEEDSFSTLLKSQTFAIGF